MNETFSPHERIRKKKDFVSLYKYGKRIHGKYLSLIYFFNKTENSRMNVVVSKKHGNAVVRNRIKRQIRSLMRKNKSYITYPIDLLVIPKINFKGNKWAPLNTDYQQALLSISRPKKTS